MPYEIIQTFIYPAFSTLLLFCIIRGSEDQSAHLRLHILILFGVGLFRWVSGDDIPVDYPRRLAVLFSMFFPGAVAIGALSVWFVNKNAPISHYKDSIAKSWLGGSFATSFFASI